MIAIVSHDAGGAEILSSWVLKIDEPYMLVLDGPAKDIFYRKLGNYKNYNLTDSLSQCDWVLTGTSWQSNLEKEAIIKSRLLNKKVISFIDHWVNYHERFIHEGKENYPDEIWVGDLEAEKIAKKIFLNTKIVLCENPYFEDIKAKLNKDKYIKNSSNLSVLYVCEPIREHALKAHGDEYYWGYVEEEAIKFFLDNIALISDKISEIIIRLHPSEKSNKYDWILDLNLNNLKISKNKTLIEDICGVDIIVGCESMALVVGLLAQKRVCSVIPPGGKICGLPHARIEHLKDIYLQQKGIPLVN